MANKGYMQKTAKKLKKSMKTGVQATNKAGFVTSTQTNSKKAAC